MVDLKGEKKTFKATHNLIGTHLKIVATIPLETLEKARRKPPLQRVKE